MANKLKGDQKKIDVNNDGVIDEKDFEMLRSLNADRTGGGTMTRIKDKKAGGGMARKYGHGGHVKKYGSGGEVCPNRPDGIRGGGCAEGGMAYRGVK